MALQTEKTGQQVDTLLIKITLNIDGVNITEAIMCFEKDVATFSYLSAALWSSLIFFNTV